MKSNNKNNRKNNNTKSSALAKPPMFLCGVPTVESPRFETHGQDAYDENHKSQTTSYRPMKEY